VGYAGVNGSGRGSPLLPLGFMPLPHIKQATGGQVFPNVQIDEIRAQEGRNLDRSDIISIFLIRLLRNFRRPSS
jgi:cytochrome c peroxidase